MISWEAFGALAVILIVVLWRYLYFFRDPDRSVPDGRNVVAPADGTIVYIKDFKDGVAPIAIKNAKEIKMPEITKCDLPSGSGHILGIYMTFWDVHVNRSPISGTVEEVAYHSTAQRNRSMALFGFQTLLTGRPSPRTMGHVLENERNTIRIRGDFVVYIVQIADFYVNKVICWVCKGQAVGKGERIGRIIMGSQVDMILPEMTGLKIMVKEGDYVKAGKTIIATY